MIEGELWKKAKEEEMISLSDNETWDLDMFPNRRKHVYSKWVFKKKMNAASQVQK